jgi:GNAT superfamily N-acetyltransferase
MITEFQVSDTYDNRPKRFLERAYKHCVMRDYGLRIMDVDQTNVDDALNVCTPSNIRHDKNIRIGYEIRKKWLLELSPSVGPCAKIAYLRNHPVGVIQFTPLQVIPYFETNRKDALYIHCMYVREEQRKKGIGSALLESLIDDVSRPNALFYNEPCSLIATSARRVYGYSQVGLFKHKGFIRTKENPDVALVLPLSTNADTKLGIPASRPAVLKEKGVKIFFKPTCQYCKRTNERVLKAEIRKVNQDIPIEECNLWTCSQEAIRRRITCVTTYVNGRPLLPSDPKKFLETLRCMASKTGQFEPEHSNNRLEGQDWKDTSKVKDRKRLAKSSRLIHSAITSWNMEKARNRPDVFSEASFLKRLV